MDIQSIVTASAQRTYRPCGITAVKSKMSVHVSERDREREREREEEEEGREDEYNLTLLHV